MAATPRCVAIARDKKGHSGACVFKGVWRNRAVVVKVAMREIQGENEIRRNKRAYERIAELHQACISHLRTYKEDNRFAALFLDDVGHPLAQSHVPPEKQADLLYQLFAHSPLWMYPGRV